MRLNLRFPYKKERRLISMEDYSRLTDEIHIAEKKYVVKFRDLKRLKKILFKSEKVGKDILPGNIVNMNSVCKVRVLNTGNIFTLKLVYPENENVTRYYISVFSSFGVALLGMKSGDTITYGMCKRYKVKILSILPYETI